MVVQISFIYILLPLYFIFCDILFYNKMSSEFVLESIKVIKLNELYQGKC